MAIAKMDHLTLVGVRGEMTSLVNALTNLGMMDLRRNDALEAELRERRLSAPGHMYQNEIPGLDFHEAFRTRMAQLGDLDLQDDGLLGRAMTDYPRYIAETQRLMDRLDAAVTLCSKVVPKKTGMFKKRRRVTAAAFRAMAARQEELTDKMRRLEEEDQLLHQLEAEYGRAGQRVAELEIYEELSLPERVRQAEHVTTAETGGVAARPSEPAADSEGEALPAPERKTSSARGDREAIQALSDAGYVRIFVGSVQDGESLEELRAALREAGCEAFAFEKIRVFNEGIALLLAAHRDEAGEVYRVAQQNGFRNLPELDSRYDGLYSLALQDRKSEMENLSKEMEDCKTRMTKLAALREDFEMLSDFYRVRQGMLKGMEKIAQSEEIFVMEGFVPQKKCGELMTILCDRYHIAVLRREAKPEENYPVLLENHALVRPFEEVVSMFSLPKPGTDVDPTALMAPTYAFFFGIMLSDIGYGLLLSLLTGFLLWKVKVESKGMRNMCYVLFMGGLMAIVWGAMFGGFFGDLVSALSNKKVNLAPLWFNPFEDPTKLMLFSVIFGVIHLFFGMGINMYQLIRGGSVYNAFTEIFPWYLIIGSGFLYAGTRSPLCKYAALLGVAMIVFFSPSESRNPLKRVLSGLLKLYGITSFFSDILSYTRILALSLATSVIAMVVNMLAALVGPSPFALIAAIPILLVGHGMNLALSGLSAYVHTTRLQYVEFFGRFYTGGGEAFQPLAAQTQYVLVEGE